MVNTLCHILPLPLSLLHWLGKHSSHIWNLVPLGLMWCIWRERNRQTFEDLDRSDDQVLALFSSSLLIGLGLGDSLLVIPLLYSLALFFFVISAFLCFCFSIFFCTFDMLVLLCVYQFFEYTFFLPIQKKKTNYAL